MRSYLIQVVCANFSICDYNPLGLLIRVNRSLVPAFYCFHSDRLVFEVHFQEKFWLQSFAKRKPLEHFEQLLVLA